MDDMGEQRMGFAVHTFQFVMQEGLLSQPSVKGTLDTAKKIIGHFKYSPLAYSLLEDIQFNF